MLAPSATQLHLRLVDVDLLSQSRQELFVKVPELARLVMIGSRRVRLNMEKGS